MTGPWIACSDRLPEVGEDIILFFRDRFHKDPSWPKTVIKSAWRCNTANPNTPNGDWAIEGRLYHSAIPFEDGIAWMPLPEAPDMDELGV